MIINSVSKQFVLEAKLNAHKVDCLTLRSQQMFTVKMDNPNGK